VDHFGLLESGSTLDLGHILPMNPTDWREMTGGVFPKFTIIITSYWALEEQMQ